MRRLFLTVGLICVAGSATAQSSSFPNPGSIKWGPAPAVFPAGAKFAVLAGDPSKSGFFTIRLSMPSGYRIMPHSHPTDERLTVLSGVFHVGMGDKFDKAKTTAFVTDGFGLVPANMHHYGWTSGRTVVQVSGMGPFQLIYVNPSDMPKAQ